MRLSAINMGFKERSRRKDRSPWTRIATKSRFDQPQQQQQDEAQEDAESEARQQQQQVVKRTGTHQYREEVRKQLIMSFFSLCVSGICEMTAATATSRRQGEATAAKRKKAASFSLCLCRDNAGRS